LRIGAKKECPKRYDAMRILMCLMTVIWALWGYTLGFGGDGLTPPPKWIGNFDHLFMKGVQAEWVDGKSVTPLYPGLTIRD